MRLYEVRWKGLHLLRLTHVCNARQTVLGIDGASHHAYACATNGPRMKNAWA